MSIGIKLFTMVFIIGGFGFSPPSFSFDPPAAVSSISDIANTIGSLQSCLNPPSIPRIPDISIITDMDPSAMALGAVGEFVPDTGEFIGSIPGMDAVNGMYGQGLAGMCFDLDGYLSGMDPRTELMGSYSAAMGTVNTAGSLPAGSLDGLSGSADFGSTKLADSGVTLHGGGVSASAGDEITGMYNSQLDSVKNDAGRQQLEETIAQGLASPDMTPEQMSAMCDAYKQYGSALTGNGLPTPAFPGDFSAMASEANYLASLISNFGSNPAGELCSNACVAAANPMCENATLRDRIRGNIEIIRP